MTPAKPPDRRPRLASPHRQRHNPGGSPSSCEGRSSQAMRAGAPARAYPRARPRARAYARSGMSSRDMGGSP